MAARDRGAQPEGMAKDAEVFGNDHDAHDDGIKGLAVRTVFGLGYAGIFIACLLLGTLPTAIFTALMSFLCCFEVYRMVRLDGKVPNEWLGLTAAVLFPLCALVDSVWLNALLFILVVSLGIWYLYSPRTRLADVSVTAFGALYTGFMLSAVVLLRGRVPGFPGALLSIGVCASVWLSDSFAYLVGRRFGRHKMSPRISPHKTWEGFAGGMAGSILIWVVLWLTGFYELTLWYALVCAVLVNILGVFGDLIESRIKRGVGVKDSCNLIPCHGGMLDRCDSLIFAGITAHLLLVIGGVL